MNRPLNSSSRTVRPISSRRQKITVIPRKTVKSENTDDSPFSSKPVEPPTLTVTAKPVKTRSRRPSKPSSSLLPLSVFFYLLRIGVIGVGLGAIAGIILPLIDPARLLQFLQIALPTPENVPEKPLEKAKPVEASPSFPSVKLSQEVTSLKTKLTTIAAKYPNLQPQAFFVDLDNGNYVNFNGETPIAAASTIKIPVLVAFFQDVDAGKAYLDEKLTMDKEVIVGGSGDMQYQSPGKQYTALETATKMIVISDNTATEMLIRRLGGKEALNQRFKEWGLSSTVINNILPDLEGTNTTSSKDLTLLLAKISQGELVSLKSRDRLMEIMQQTKTRTLLPQGIEENANIAHKTGDIGSVLGDAGVIDIPNGKRYIGTIITKRPHNDEAGRKLIQEMSRTAYQHFKWYLPNPIVNQPSPSVSPSVTSSPSPSPSPLTDN